MEADDEGADEWLALDPRVDHDGPCVVPVSGEARRHQDFGRRFEGCRKVDGLVLGIGRRQVGAVLRPAFATERWRIGEV